jgi:arylsulfatase A-like enzyme
MHHSTGLPNAKSTDLSVEFEHQPGDLMPKKPNLLLIWTDQQRDDTLKCYGNTATQAPHLNHLASQSFVFRNAYCVQPVCTPSRGTIMSGLWPHAHGARSNNIPLHAETRTLAEMVSSDYRRAHFGKWHLGNEIFPQHGFDEWTGIEDLYIQHYTDEEKKSERSAYHHHLVKFGFAPDSEKLPAQRIFSRNFSAAMTEPFTKAGFLGETVSDCIRNHNPDTPFVFNVNFLEPHPPPFGPLNNLHDPDDLTLPETFGEPPGPDIQYKARVRAEEFATEGMKGYPLKTEWDWKRLMANYNGLVTMVDKAVGKILEALEASGMADNTIVAFTSDHGDMQAEHSMFKKGIMYEGAMRIPMLIKVPWLAREQTMIDGRFSHIDLVPTLLDLMGEPVGTHLHGESRIAVLKGEDTLLGRDIYAQWNEKQGPQYECRTIITADGWKFSLFCEDESMLFDLTNDPHERQNLVRDPAQRDRVRDLTARLRSWQQSIDDPLELPDLVD